MVDPLADVLAKTPAQLFPLGEGFAQAEVGTVKYRIAIDPMKMVFRMISSPPERFDGFLGRRPMSSRVLSVGSAVQRHLRTDSWDDRQPRAGGVALHPQRDGRGDGLAGAVGAGAPARGPLGTAVQRVLPTTLTGGAVRPPAALAAHREAGT